MIPLFLLFLHNKKMLTKLARREENDFVFTIRQGIFHFFSNSTNLVLVYYNAVYYGLLPSCLGLWCMQYIIHHVLLYLCPLFLKKISL